MRRTFVIVATLGMALFAAGGGPALTTSTVVKFSPAHTYVTPGSPNFTVDVRAENVVTSVSEGNIGPCPGIPAGQHCGLGAYEFRVSFDEAVIQWVSTVKGTWLFSTGRVENLCWPTSWDNPTIGQVAYQCTTKATAPPDPGPHGPDGSGVLATLTFSPLAEGYTDLTFEKATLLEIAAVPIPSTPENGSVTVAPLADLQATKTAPGTVTAPPGSVAYTVGATNLGPNTANSVTAVDTLSTDVTYVSSSAGCNYEAPPTHKVTCDLGTLNASQSNTKTINVSVAATVAGKTIVNPLDVSSTTVDPVTSNNHVEASTLVNPSNVEVIKTVPGHVAKGASGQYQIVVTSLGPSKAIGVSMTDVLPAGVTGGNYSTNLGSCTYAPLTRLLSCNLGDMVVGASGTITIDVTFPNQDAIVCNQAAANWTRYPSGSSQSGPMCTTVGLDDDDGDGCPNIIEQQIGFNPANRWDLYDVPVPARADPTANGPKNKVMDIADALAVLFYAFTQPTGVCGDNPNGNGVDYDCLKDGDWNGPLVMLPDGVLDDWDKVGLRYDRSISLSPNPPWDAGAPNGAIDISDALTTLAQFGIDCTRAP